MKKKITLAKIDSKYRVKYTKDQQQRSVMTKTVMLDYLVHRILEDNPLHIPPYNTTYQSIENNRDNSQYRHEFITC